MKIKVRGFEMAYEDTGGSGVPLLLVHGFPLDHTLWSAQKNIADVARIIAPDLRGFGASKMTDDAVTMDSFADDVRALLDALGVKSVAIAGLSMGGYVAFAFYRKYPQRVRALIFANTKAGADSPEGKKARDDNATLARAQGTAAVAERMFPKMLTLKNSAEKIDVANTVRAMMSRQPVDGVIAALMAMRDRPDSAPTLAQISVPTLIITGAEDTLIPPKESELMRDGIRGAQLVVIPGAAHLSNVEQPEVFNQAVRKFLQSIT